MNTRRRMLILAFTIAQTLTAQEPAPFRLAVDVDLVVLHATVRDRNGRVVSDLREQDVEVYEDDIRQPIRLFQFEDVPVTVGIVVDHSGSMRTKLPEVIAAARSFVQSSNSEDEMFVVNFNENVRLGLPRVEPFTSNSAALEDAISQQPATGMTALYDAVALGIEGLLAGSHDKKVLLVISDGGDNASKSSFGDVLGKADKAGAILYTIGLFGDTDPDRNPGVLKRLARETGGESYLPGEMSSIASTCERIAEDIRNQYTIGYTAADTQPDGRFRSIRIIAKSSTHKKLSVRTRSGYVARRDGGAEAH